MNIFTERLNELLDKRGMTQRELAEKIGTTEVSVSRYCSGQRVPKGPAIVKMAQALNVKTDYLLGHDDTNDSKSDLKPCPFCGGKATAMMLHPTRFKKTMLAVMCDDCGGAMVLTVTDEDVCLRDAKEAWNRREGLEA